MSGWYPDPTGRFEYRFHNGGSWTADVSTGGRRFVDPLTPSTPAPRGGDSNGLAVAGMVCGIVAVAIAIVPFVGVLGLLAGIVGLALSIPALARSRRTGSRRGFALAGIITSSCGIVLGVLGIVLTVVIVRAIDRFDDPGPVEVAIDECMRVGGGEVRADVRVHNRSSDERSYTVEVDLGGSTTEWVEVDDVPPGESVSVPVIATTLRSEPTCDVVNVHGPTPFGLDPDVFD